MGGVRVRGAAADRGELGVVHPQPPAIILACELADCLHPVGRERVGAEERRAAASLLAREALQEVAEAVRVVPGAGHDLDAEAVGLALVGPRERRERALGRDLGRDALHPTAAAEDARENVGLLRLRETARAVARGAVGHLVRDGARQLARAADVRDQPGVDVHQPAGHVERVDRVVADDEELPLAVAEGRLASHRLPDLVDVAGQRGVVGERELGPKLGFQLTASLPLLVDRVVVGAAERGAAAERERQHGEEKTRHHENRGGGRARTHAPPRRVPAPRPRASPGRPREKNHVSSPCCWPREIKIMTRLLAGQSWLN